MGGSLFLGIRGVCVAQALLLVICGVFCLGGKVNALRCRYCASVRQLAPCLPAERYCRVYSGVCFSLKIYEENHIDKFIQGCLNTGDKTCDTTWENPATQRRYAVSCCSDRDKCNFTRMLPRKPFA